MMFITFLVTIVMILKNHPSCGLPITQVPQRVISPEEFGGGDIKVPPLKTTMLRGAAMAGSYVKWPGGVVPYTISSAYNQAVILSAMRTLENATLMANGSACLTFRPAIPADGQYYIQIENGIGCSSYVGRYTGYTLNRTVTLEIPSCINAGVIEHELIHALGFYHEQSRPDRDTYVKINWANIQTGMSHNFDKYNSSEVVDLYTPYDYDSIMHYGRTFFSANGLDTIEPINPPNASIGTRNALSPIDIQELQIFYGCIPALTTTTTTTVSPITTTSTTTTTTTETTSTTIGTTTTTTETTSTTTGTTTTTTQTTSTTTETTTTTTTTGTTTSTTTGTTTSTTTGTTTSTTTGTTTSTTTGTTTSTTTETTTTTTTGTTTTTTTETTSTTTGTTTTTTQTTSTTTETTTTTTGTTTSTTTGTTTTTTTGTATTTTTTGTTTSTTTGTATTTTTGITTTAKTTVVIKTVVTTATTPTTQSSNTDGNGSSSGANVGIIVGPVVGGVVGVLLVLGILAAVLFFFFGLGAPLLSNASYVSYGLGASKSLGGNVFQSGNGIGSFFKDGVWHTTQNSRLAFYPNANNTVFGKGVDQMGSFVARGVYSPRTQRIAFDKHYQPGFADAGMNTGRKMKVHAKWNPNNESFEGKYYLKNGSRYEKNTYVLRYGNRAGH
ncbi:unnamed protein product [Adineta ricciae]|uniref:Metalloendopeptidase n=1 Tax=Adineta ricciae TaxID=249248 RepID=A0A815QJF8_ADIRI|nr:unnamed protein product [Adineta ricciae]